MPKDLPGAYVMYSGYSCEDVERVIEIPSATRSPHRVRVLRNAVRSSALIHFECDEHEATLQLDPPYDPRGDGSSRMLVETEGAMPIEVVAYALRAAGYEVEPPKTEIRTSGDALRALGLPEWAVDHDEHAKRRGHSEHDDDEDAGEDEDD